MTFLAAAALLLTVASLIVVGGVIFALFIFLPLFLLALVGIVAGTKDRTVQQHDPPMSPSSWRNGS